MTTIWEDLRDPPSRSARWRATLRKQPSAFLLAVQLLVILLLPLLEDSEWGRAVISLLSLSALITSLYPAVTVLLAVVVLRERIHREQAAGLALCATSIVCVSLA